MDFPNLLTAREAAPLLDVAVRTVHRRAAARQIPHYMIGGRRLFDEATVRVLAASGAK